jgi:hypothetical protein
VAKLSNGFQSKRRVFQDLDRLVLRIHDQDLVDPNRPLQSSQTEKLNTLPLADRMPVARSMPQSAGEFDSHFSRLSDIIAEHSTICLPSASKARREDGCVGTQHDVERA